MHQCELRAARDQAADHRLQRTAVAQSSQRVGMGLFLCRGLRALQSLAVFLKGVHDGRFRLDQVQHLDREVGRREISAGQVVAAHRVDQADPE